MLGQERRGNSADNQSTAALDKRSRLADCLDRLIVIEREQRRHTDDVEFRNVFDSEACVISANETLGGRIAEGFNFVEDRVLAEFDIGDHVGNVILPARVECVARLQFGVILFKQQLRRELFQIALEKSHVVLPIFAEIRRDLHQSHRRILVFVVRFNQ